MRQTVQFSVLFLIFLLFETPISWAEQVFTKNKQRLCTQCAAYEWPLEKPLHGIVVVSGSIFNPEVEWIFLDIDSKKITKVAATRGEGTPPWIARKVESRTIKHEDIEPLVRMANTIWSSGVLRPQNPSPTDGWQELYLLDEGNIRHERYINSIEITNQVRPTLLTTWNNSK